MNKSESIKNIATALLSFQGEIGKIKKEAKNPFFKSTYASLPNILDAIQEPLQSSGLSFMQLPCGDHGLNTLIMHAESGEWISSEYNMRPVKDDPQGRGSCITYMRRYALAAALGLNIDEDDDGNAASRGKPALKRETPEWSKAIEYLSAGNNIKKIAEKYDLTKASDELCDYCESLLLTSSYDDRQQKHVMQILGSKPYEIEVDKIITDLDLNQVDAIESGGNYTQTDIANKLKKIR